MKSVYELFSKCYLWVSVRFWYLYFLVVLQGKIEGEKNLPEGGFIIAANHVSYLDWLILVAVFKKKYARTIHFLGKSKLTESAFWRYHLKISETIVVDYDDPRSVKRSFMEMLARVKNSEIVGIFPEGARSRDGKLMQAREGIGRLVGAVDAPVVPIGLDGFYDAWPRHRKTPGVARCTINIGRPVMFNIADYPNRKEAKCAITHLIMHHIAALVDQDYAHTPEPVEPLINSLETEEAVI